MYGPGDGECCVWRASPPQNLCANAWRLHGYPQWKDHPLRFERGFKTSLPAHSFPGFSDTVFCGSSDCATLSGTVGPAGFSCQSSFKDDVRVCVATYWGRPPASHLPIVAKIVKFITNRGWANNELKWLNLLLLLFFVGSFVELDGKCSRGIFEIQWESSEWEFSGIRRN